MSTGIRPNGIQRPIPREIGCGEPDAFARPNGGRWKVGITNIVAGTLYPEAAARLTPGAPIDDWILVDPDRFGADIGGFARIRPGEPEVANTSGTIVTTSSTPSCPG